MVKRFLILPLAKPKYKAEDVLKICELFIYREIRYTVK
jgi:hypothetical protein